MHVDVALFHVRLESPSHLGDIGQSVLQCCNRGPNPVT